MLYRYYRIKSLIDNKSYIGKTKKTIGARLKTHHDNLKKYLNGKNRKCGSYKIIQDKVENVDYIIELLFELDVEQEPTERVIEQILINQELMSNPAGCCNARDAYKFSNKEKNQSSKEYTNNDAYRKYKKEYMRAYRAKLAEKEAISETPAF